MREDENYEEEEDEEYDYANPNPVFKQEDFDPMPANASKKRTFQFEDLADEDQQNRLHYEEDDGVNYEDNEHNNNDDYVAQHDTHVNGRMLHSKLSGVRDDEPKETGGYNQRDVHDTHKALTSDITRLHTLIKRQQNTGIYGNHRHLPLDTRMSNSHNGRKSNIRHQDNVPNVVVKFKQNLLQNVIQTPPVTKSDWNDNPQVKVVRLPDHPGDFPATQIQTPRLPRQLGPVVYSNDGFPLVEDSIFWSQKVESFVPKGN